MNIQELCWTAALLLAAGGTQLHQIQNKNTAEKRGGEERME
ncbi:MAG: hypothetical protein ACLTY5_07855 [Angelakisella sp.]